LACDISTRLSLAQFEHDDASHLLSAPAATFGQERTFEVKAEFAVEPTFKLRHGGFDLTRVYPFPLPPGALLAAYASSGAYTDCYAAEVATSVSQAQFVEAFYTGGVFKLERALIRLFLSRASTDVQARQLARGEIGEFAAWRVEEQTTTQLLMCDLAGQTRSWLMVEPTVAGTKLFFGSAVVPSVDRTTGERRMGFLFRALLGFHKVYSRVLLSSARSRLAGAGGARL